MFWKLTQNMNASFHDRETKRPACLFKSLATSAVNGAFPLPRPTPPHSATFALPLWRIYLCLSAQWAMRCGNEIPVALPRRGHAAVSLAVCGALLFVSDATSPFFVCNWAHRVKLRARGRRRKSKQLSELLNNCVPITPMIAQNLNFAIKNWSRKHLNIWQICGGFSDELTY